MTHYTLESAIADMLLRMEWDHRRGIFLWLALSSLVACSFDTSNQPISDDGGIGRFDGPMGRPDAIAPGDCPEPIKLEIQVNGVSTPPPANQPYVQTLIGDTVQLSATGTCTQSGTIIYEWSIGPQTGLGTAFPDLKSEVISVFSLQREQYTARLKVLDGTGNFAVTEIFAFEARGFENLPAIVDIDVKDLSAGADYLWLGGKQGAYRTDLATPGVYVDVGDVYNGDSPPSNIGAVHESADGALVWFGSDNADGEAYRLDLATNVITQLNTISGAKTKDIADATAGVRVGTDLGVALATDNENFVEERNESVDVVGFGSLGAFAGGDKLYPLPNGTAIDVFGGNNKIKGITDDGILLWIGSDGQGVARLMGTAVQQTYKAVNSKLGSDKVRNLITDSVGDIWAATQLGVSRFKQDRQVWVPMGANSGLGAASDLKSITIDDSGGRRAIYAGGKDGLSVMRLNP